MKYLKIKENYGESIIIGYLILAVLFPFAAVMFLGEKNFTSAALSLCCAALSVLSMLDNILSINLITKINELNADNSWWKGKYEKECCTCTELCTKQIKLEHELNMKKSNGDGYYILLHKCGPSKIRVVKFINEHITHNLREAKALADSVPCIIAENLSEDDANLIHNELTNVGASVSIKC